MTSGKMIDKKGADIDECWDKLEEMKWDIVDGVKEPRGDYDVTQWIHLQDALWSCTVSKSECYDAIKLGYCPEGLKVRQSRYQHLI
jgi:hypothetical protein